MHVLGFRRSPWFGVVALLGLLPGVLRAQLRTIVSNEIAVSGREATLRLDFEDQAELIISLQEGQVLVDGETVGGYERGDALDLAWRSLLGDVVSLEDGPLADALFDWTPPRELTGTSEEVARTLDQALEGALVPPEVAEDRETTAEGRLELSDESSLLGALLSRSDALQELAEALQGASLDDFTLRIGQDLAVGAGEEMDRSVILVDGDLDVEGVIRGDVVVTNGTVRLLDGGLITGDLRVVDGEVESLGGEVEGEIVQPSQEDLVNLDSRELRALREDLEREIRQDILSSMERETRPSPRSILAPFRNVGRAIAGLLETLVAFLVLAVLGTLVVHFARDRLEVVATTARRAPAQSAMVGLAGGFLLLPVWILGIVALAISIIGIPVLLAWVPLFPIAAGVAGLLGYVAVARNVGEWVADQEYRGLEWIRGSNTFYVVIAGLGALMIPAVAASLVRILGFGLLQGLLGFLGSAISFVALAIGFGAVLMSRGGRIRPYAAYYDFEEDLWAEEEAAPGPGEAPTREQPSEGVHGSASADRRSPEDHPGSAASSKTGKEEVPKEGDLDEEEGGNA